MKASRKLAFLSVFCMLFVLCACGTSSIEKITLPQYSSIFDVSETLELEYKYNPTDASTDAIEIICSEPEIADASIISAEGGTIRALITPKSRGEAQITCKSGDVYQTVSIKIKDEAAEAAEKKAAEEEAARKAAEEEAAKKAAKEEAARKAAEEEAAKKATEEEAARKAAEEAAAQQEASTEGNSASGSSSGSKTSNSSSGSSGGGTVATGTTVYITPSGKRYHLISTCGGKNSYAVDISQVGGRTPCKKCAK